MLNRFAVRMLVGAAVLVGTVQAQDQFGKRATWKPPTPVEAKGQLDAWLKTQKLDELARAKVDALWPQEESKLSAGEILEQLTTTFAALDDKAKTVVNFCASDKPFTGVPPKFPILVDKATPAIVKHNLNLLYGKWLAQNRFYDESLEHLSNLKPSDVVDPATLLFYQSASYHRLLKKDKCLPVLTKLMENEDSLPRRYSTLARLMEADLKPLKTDSLDEVSRLMDDISRRLDLGRAGKRVRKEEDDVVAKLDKMIEELEKQQQQQGGGTGAGNLQPSSPAQDSSAMQGKGPGNVDQRRVGNGVGWGNLPPKQREEALQMIGKELPAHYRQVIEQYFRKLARDGVE